MLCGSINNLMEQKKPNMVILVVWATAIIWFAGCIPIIKPVEAQKEIRVEIVITGVKKDPVTGKIVKSDSKKIMLEVKEIEDEN